MAVGSINHSSHILAQGGFEKLEFKARAELGQKIRLYHLKDLTSEKIENARLAILQKRQQGYTYDGKLEMFEIEIRINPYLIKEGSHLELISQEQVSEIQKIYSNIKIEKSSTALELLKQNHIAEPGQLIEFYNRADPSTREMLRPLFNTMLVIFEKELPNPSLEEIKTIIEFAYCDDKGIRGATLNLLIDLFEHSGFGNADYGYGLKYFIDNLPEKFLKVNQLLLLNIFNKLSQHLGSLLHKGKGVNHEIEPIMAALISTSRALVNSGLNELNKDTKDAFYEKLKAFYYDQEYGERLISLNQRTNYLLVFEALWPIQHLVRMSSSEHKAITFLRKTGHGLITIKTLAGAPLKAAVKLYQQGELPDENLIPELMKAYEHGKKAFGIKDIPKPWYDMLEMTEALLINPKVTVEYLEEAYRLAKEYNDIREDFNQRIKETFKECIAKDKVSLQETKEFAFGFVGQISDLAIDHPNITVRLKAIELMGEIFDMKKQDEDVRVLILTTLQNILDKEGFEPEFIQHISELQLRLHHRKESLASVELFRKSKYPCLPLIKENTSLLDAAKQKLSFFSLERKPLPKSEFLYGYTETKIFEDNVEVGGDFIPKPPAPIKLEELQAGVIAATTLHQPMIDKNSGKLAVRTEIGNKKQTTFKGTVKITGDFKA